MRSAKRAREGGVAALGCGFEPPRERQTAGVELIEPAGDLAIGLGTRRGGEAESALLGAEFLQRNLLVFSEGGGADEEGKLE